MRLFFLFFILLALAIGAISASASDDQVGNYKLRNPQDRETLRRWHALEAHQQSESGKGRAYSCDASELLVNKMVASDLKSNIDPSLMPCPSKQDTEVFSKYLVILNKVAKLDYERARNKEEVRDLTNADSKDDVKFFKELNSELNLINRHLNSEMDGINDEINHGYLWFVWPGKKAELLSKQQNILKEQELIRKNIQANIGYIKSSEAEAPEPLNIKPVYQQRFEADESEYGLHYVSGTGK